LPGEGIDLEHYKNKNKNKMNMKGTMFLMVSRLLKEKGVIEFVEAAKSLKYNVRDVKFVLIGKHPIGEANSIDPELLVSWTTEGIIEYHGEVDDVRPYIDRSDCVVLPSYREGLPRSILEAFSMEKLVVASNVPGCKQLVKQNVTGFLCEPANVESLTNALKEFMSLNRHDRTNMEKSARKIVRNYYSDEIINQYYLDYINSK
jgi:glycosyltransferase involved in cell wall biosynthesis